MTPRGEVAAAAAKLVEVTAEAQSSARAQSAEDVRASAFVEFREAVLDFSDEPTPENLARYLDASRGLEAPSNNS